MSPFFSIKIGWQIPPEELGLWQLLVNARAIDLEGEGIVALEPGVDPVFFVPAGKPGHAPGICFAAEFP